MHFIKQNLLLVFLVQLCKNKFYMNAIKENNSFIWPHYLISVAAYIFMISLYLISVATYIIY